MPAPGTLIGPAGSEGLVLITGGTGAVGRPLVEALAADRTPLVVLARRPGEAPADFVPGDVLAAGTLSMPPDAADVLRARVTTIVHAAALTRFDAPLELLRQVNVEGTRHVLEFAASCPRLQRLSVLSTIYVAGRRTGAILEGELDHGCGFVNAYEQSKYEAEQLVRDWMPRLPIAVCRLSTVLGDWATGRVRQPAAIHHAVRFLYHSLLPMIPGTSDSPVDLISTDYAVAALRHLSGPGFRAGATFHVAAGADTLSEAELIDLAIDAFLRYRPAWRRRAIEKPMVVPLETFELFRQSVDAVADQALRSSVAVLGHFAPQLAFPKRFDDRACRSALAEAAVVRPSIRDTVDRVVRYLIEHNWGAAADHDNGGSIRE